MFRDVVGISIILVFYLCLFIVVFAPTIYAFWIYLVGRKVSLRRKGFLRTVISTFLINALVAGLMFNLAYGYLLRSKIAENEAITLRNLSSAVDAQKRFFASHGRYYEVGPIRGPYKDDHGLQVDKDVIVEVMPSWNKARQKEDLHAYAIHIWGKSLLLLTKEGKIETLLPDSEQTSRIRSRLLNSVK